MIRSFNPRARVGRDGRCPLQVPGHQGFNPRARVGRDSRVCDTKLSCRVSIHAPAWGATMAQTAGSKRKAEFQSTRPRGARRDPPRGDQNLRKVSIHAPAWGATTCGASVGNTYTVSIHAPAWGATCHPTRECDPRTCFNPRARVGRDSMWPRTAVGQARFNPRARVGRDRSSKPITRCSN